MTRAIVGIDPGASGALAALCGDALEVWDMPTHDIKGKKRLDLHRLNDMVRGIAGLYEPRLAVIEDVHSMPKQGVASSFAFGFAAAAAQAFVVAYAMPMRLVPPSGWKRLMGLSADKDESRRKASQLFPRFASLWSRSKDDGRAEAVLLAYYGSRL